MVSEQRHKEITAQEEEKAEANRFSSAYLLHDQIFFACRNSYGKQRAMWFWS